MIQKSLAVLATAVLATILAGPAQADPPNGPKYGPEGRLYMNVGKGWAKQILVPRGGIVKVTFHFDAVRENAITIYDKQGNLLCYRNNYQSAAPTIITYGMLVQKSGFAPGAQWLYITSWHKAHRPGKGPWYQSPMKSFRTTGYYPAGVFQEKSYWFGFEDMNVHQGNAFNDAQVRLKKLRSK